MSFYELEHLILVHFIISHLQILQQQTEKQRIVELKNKDNFNDLKVHFGKISLVYIYDIDKMKTQTQRYLFDMFSL